MKATCDWCKREGEYGDEPTASVQCYCGRWFYLPLPDAQDTLVKCSQCGRRCDSYTDIAGKRCYLCAVPKL